MFWPYQRLRCAWPCAVFTFLAASAALEEICPSQSKKALPVVALTPRFSIGPVPSEDHMLTISLAFGQFQVFGMRQLDRDSLESLLVLLLTPGLSLVTHAVAIS